MPCGILSNTPIVDDQIGQGVCYIYLMTWIMCHNRSDENMNFWVVISVFYNEWVQSRNTCSVVKVCFRYEVQKHNY